MTPWFSPHFITNFPFQILLISYKYLSFFFTAKPSKHILCFGCNHKKWLVHAISRESFFSLYPLKKYYSSYRDQEDLISIGTIGLIKAVSTFDYTKGTKFATYASRCIENEILMHFRSKKKSAHDLYLSDAIDTDKDGNSITWSDVLPDEGNILDDVDLHLQSEQMYRYVKLLPEREQTILTLRYGLYGSRPLTQREVAKKLDISRSYVSRLEKKALATLNDYFSEKKPKA